MSRLRRIWHRILGSDFVVVIRRGFRWLLHQPRDFFRLLRRNRLALIVTGLILLLLVIYLSPNIFIVIYPGQRGVLWKRFGGGTVIDRSFGEGLQVIAPWNIMYIYNVRFQNERRVINALTSDGLEVDVVVSTRYRPRIDELGALHKTVGPAFLDVIIIPEIGESVRDQISQYRPAELYALNREGIQREILSDSRLEAALRFVQVDDVLIRGITLPKAIEDAIQRKLEEEQRVLQYEFRLDVERLEADRKVVEAEGIRSFQEIVTGGISEPFLRWKGIDATLELARSSNAKVVVIGGGEDGLPLILGNLEPGPSPTPAPEPPAPLLGPLTPLPPVPF